MATETPDLAGESGIRRASSPTSHVPRAAVWVDAVAPTLVLRGVILVFAALAVVVFRPEVLGDGSPVDMWNRWDAPHFLEIARSGYGPPADPARIVLFPLFPVLIAAGSVFADPALVGMAIAFAATLASAAGIYRLVRIDSDRPAARGAVVLLSIFPTAFTLVAPYSEAPFLAFTVWAFVFARTGRWPAAGLFALYAGATRIQGAFLLPALIVEYWLQRRRFDRGAGWLALGLGGPLIYLAINLLTFGNPLYFLDVQRDVFRVSTIAPWDALGHLVAGVLAFRPQESWVTVYLAPLLAFVTLGAVLVWTILGRGGRASYAVYTAISLVSFASLSWPISVPRYLMGVFPIFLAGGAMMTRPWLAIPLLVASGLLFALFTTLFVIGHWAF